MSAARWRKKPVEVDAWQWDGTEDEAFAIQKWVNDQGGSAIYMGERPTPSRAGGIAFMAPPSLVIKTLEGDMNVGKGDFVIRGVQDEFYPCKPDIFEATYDAVTVDS